jgi:hypothetical protein
MNIVTKSLLSLSIGLALSSAVSAQTAPVASPKPTPSTPAKVEHSAKHKAAVAPQESSKPLQPMAAGKQLPVSSKDTLKETKENKEASNTQPAKVKHEKSLTSATTPAVKPEPAAKPSK